MIMTLMKQVADKKNAKKKSSRRSSKLSTSAVATIKALYKKAQKRGGKSSAPRQSLPCVPLLSLIVKSHNVFIQHALM